MDEQQNLPGTGKDPMADMLALLASAPEDQLLSGQRMAETLGITRMAVCSRIQRLAQAGWRVEAVPRRGYRLVRGDRLDPVLWQGALDTAALGRGEVYFADVLPSTNLQLKAMAVSGAPHGSLCLAEQQTAGKGRLGRTWHSPAGQGLWVSVLLRPDLPPAHAPLLTLCASMAMADGVAETWGGGLGIKWPNDLVLAGKKVCGILTEVAMHPDGVDYVVVGTGLNVRRGAYPPELSHQATSLEDHGATPLRRRVLAAYLHHLEKWTALLVQHGPQPLIQAYGPRCVTLGKRVNVTGAITFTGLAEGLREDGSLLVRREDGTLQPVLSGDVSVRGVMGYV